VTAFISDLLLNRLFVVHLFFIGSPSANKFYQFPMENRVCVVCDRNRKLNRLGAGQNLFLARGKSRKLHTHSTHARMLFCKKQKWPKKAWKIRAGYMAMPNPKPNHSQQPKLFCGFCGLGGGTVWMGGATGWCGHTFTLPAINCTDALLANKY